MTTPSPLDALPDVLHVGNTGRTVLKGDIAQMPYEEQQTLWYEVSYTTPDGAAHTRPEWPFIGDTFHFRGAGTDEAPGTKPMPRAELEGLGLDDAQLSEEHAAYFAAGERLDPHASDTLPLQQLRRRLYDETAAAWYGDAKRLHGH